jgi:hypothetical protein
MVVFPLLSVCMLCVVCVLFIRPLLLLPMLEKPEEKLWEVLEKPERFPLMLPLIVQLGMLEGIVCCG